MKSRTARTLRRAALPPLRASGRSDVDRGRPSIFADLLADPSALLPFILIGFAAQMIDGALGMAFGQISSTLLVTMGVPPAAASAGVHTAETFTTAVSGISHVAHRNVDWRLFSRIVVPGVIGGVTGAYLLTQINADVATPFVLAYLTSLGLYLLYRGIMHRHTERGPRSSRRSAWSAASSTRPAAAAGARSSPPTCWSRAAIRARRSAPSTPPNSSSPSPSRRPSSPRSAGKPLPSPPSAC